MNTNEDRCNRVYEYVISCWQDGGKIPSLQQIGEEVGLKSKSAVSAHRDALIKLGLLAKQANGRIRVVVERVSTEKGRGVKDEG
jgi:SOS-response transcriptional repressor LexA